MINCVIRDSDPLPRARFRKPVGHGFHLADLACGNGRKNQTTVGIEQTEGVNEVRDSIGHFLGCLKMAMGYRAIEIIRT